MNDIALRIKQRREELGMSAEQLGEKIGKAKTTIYRYESGYIEKMPSSVLSDIAKALNVSPTYLLFGDTSKDDSILFNSSLRPVTLKRFPMLGEIACGKPIFASEEHEAYIDASANIKADFCVTARGDSMTGARIFNGDIVFIKEQSIVDNGQIAAVIVDNEVTLKRWYYYPEKSKLVLQAENPKYEPFVFVGKELDTIRCLGRAVSFMSNL